MGIEIICDVCGSPMCAFTMRGNGSRVCMRCIEAERVGASVNTMLALGALTANSRGYKPSKRGYTDRLSLSPLASKTMALIKHDRILRGES